MSSIKTDICTWPHCTHTAKDQCKGLGPRSDADTITRLEAEVERLTRTNDAKREHRDILLQETQRLRAALAYLDKAYVNLLEAGRDKIIELGGTCDPVDVMEAGDPALRQARAALSQEPKP